MCASVASAVFLMFGSHTWLQSLQHCAVSDETTKVKELVVHCEPPSLILCGAQLPHPRVNHLTTSDDMFQEATCRYVALEKYIRGLGASELSKEQGDEMREIIRLLQQTASRGHGGTQTLLGALYSESLGVERNYIEAAILLRKAPDQGVAAAQVRLAAM